MPQIYYTASDYTGLYAHLNRIQRSSIRCRKIDLLRSIITVGNPSFITKQEIKNNGLFRTLSNSIIRKILLVQINIESNQGNIHLHPIFQTHVTDEKRIVSYNLGMAIAKLYASELFNIPNLIHIETLKQQGVIDFNHILTAREPDLVGRSPDGLWHVFEAKGRSSNSLNTALIDAKEQAAQVNLIHGNTPGTLNACATYFSDTEILSKIKDPESKKIKNINLNYNKYIESYYNSFFAFDKDIKKRKIENIEYNYFDIKAGELDLSIGLETEIYELLQQKNFDYINSYYLKKQNMREDFQLEGLATQQLSIGEDGFIVKYSNFN